jgi:hypothetical protein
LARIEFFAGQNPQFIEDSGQCFLGLVDNKDWATECGRNVFRPARPQGFEASPPIVGEQWHAEDVAEFAIEIHGSRLWMFDGADDDVAKSGEALTEQAQRHAFSRAGIACDHDIATVGDAELDTAEEGVDRGCGVQGLDGNVGAKGVEFEAVQGL